MRHRDFERIYSEFINYYKNQAKGEYEYYEWLKALQLDESLPYNQARESFQWAKDMIQLMREDKDNKYYRVLLAFPIESMNGNVYSERDLIAAAMRIKGKSPDMNHKSQFWFSPDNIYNRWGTVTTEGSKYEDGAVEVIMKVPKTTLCPVCNEKDKPLYKLIDEKRIVNVSLNGFNATEYGGFQFDENIPYTLLTSTVLPGIPLARIFPMESYLPFSQSSINKKRGKKRMIKVVGLKEKKQVGEPFADYTDFADCVAKNQDKDDPEAYCAAIKQKAEQAMPENRVCPDGYHFDSNVQDCVKNEEPESPVDKVAPELTDTPVGDAVAPDTGPQIMGESASSLKVQVLRQKQKIEALELSNAEDAEKLEKAYEQVNQMIGEEKQLKEQISRLEKQVDRLNSEKASDADIGKTMKRQIEDLTESRDGYKKIAEEKTDLVESLVAKYKTALETNVKLNQDITEANEEIIELHKQVDRKEEALKKSKNLAGKIRAIGLNQTK